MKLMNRLYVLIGTFFWSFLLFWYFGSLFAFALFAIGILYVVIGGKINA